jgi:hypothetical protein
MANKASGSTFTYGSSAIGSIVSISFSNQADDIDTTSLSDSSHLHEAGQTDPEVTVELVGTPHTSLSIGVTGSVNIAWANGITSTFATCVVMGHEVSGAVGDKIATTITFKRSVA